MSNFNFLMQNTLLVLFLAGLSFTSCKKTVDPVPPVLEADYKSLLTNLTNNVIVATYADLDGKASILVSEVQNFQEARTAINLNNVRQAWRDTRAPWEKSEGFLFGPVDTKGIDPSIDDWPVNVIDIDNIMSSGNAITEEFIDLAGTTSKGFHTIEYLLWGIDGSKALTDFTDREFEYLAATVENLRNKTAILSYSWDPVGENYSANLINAGTVNSVFVTQKAALQQLVEAAGGIANEVGTGKIAGPLGEEDPDPTQEESRFSHNSKNDFSNNIKSVSNIYNGSYNVGSLGISAIIKDKDTDLDARVLVAIKDAINAIDDIPGNFTNAISDNRADVEDARDKVILLRVLLEGEVLDVIKAL